MTAEVRTWINLLAGVGLASSIGVSDAFRFHTFGTVFDEVLILTAIGALGLHVVMATVVPAVRLRQQAARWGREVKR